MILPRNIYAIIQTSLILADKGRCNVSTILLNSGLDHGALKKATKIMIDRKLVFCERTPRERLYELTQKGKKFCYILQASLLYFRSKEGIVASGIEKEK